MKTHSIFIKSYSFVGKASVLLGFLLLLVTSQWKSLSATPMVPGSGMLNISRSMESFSLGGSTAGLEMGGRNFVANPGLASTALQQMVMATIGYSTESINFTHVGYLHPTEYGVFGGYYGHFYNQQVGDFFFTLGPVFSKEINQLISLGGMIFFDYYAANNSPADDNIQAWGLNASLSLNVRPDWDLSKWVFTIREFIGSAQVDQVGLVPWVKDSQGSTHYLKNGDIFKVGTGITVMQATFPKNSGTWKLRLHNDLGLTFPFDFAYHLGLKNAFLFDGKFKEFSFMVGHFRDPALEDAIPVSFGFGTVFTLADDIEMEVAYSAGLNRRNSSMESYHSIGFNIHFGEVDNIDPVISSPLGDEGVLELDTIEE